jgi:hypothetical protein
MFLCFGADIPVARRGREFAAVGAFRFTLDKLTSAHQEVEKYWLPCPRINSMDAVKLKTNEFRWVDDFYG